MNLLGQEYEDLVEIIINFVCTNDIFVRTQVKVTN